MVGLQGQAVRSIPLGEALSEVKRVPADGEIVRTARRLGISFGD
jgi:6-phosphofructokinase 1